MISSYRPSIYSIISFLIVSIGYHFQTTLIILYYYKYKKEKYNDWKIQKYFENKNHKYYNYFTNINLVNASLFAFFITELTVLNISNLKFYNINNIYSIIFIMLETVCIIIYENIVEYYWHRLMHINYFYITFHKYHHYFKSPQPYNDMFIHPIEAIGYYTILYSPAILFPIHSYSFILYMIYMGIFGVLDHSGVIFEIPYIYNTVVHDLHHKLYNVNYCFPNIFMDLIHNTYHDPSLVTEKEF